ncbi:leucyl aminopeptidase [Gammaproteobacteria bacterium SCGC AG-212-F23]|nr:leucyl aminopeptidase [Gammaproteobacteria bacterium SCGC AG-212-F23]
MLICFTTEKSKQAIPIELVKQNAFDKWLSGQNQFVKNWVSSHHFRADPGSMSLLPDTVGKLSRVICGVPDVDAFWAVAQLPLALPEDDYFFVKENDSFAMAWGLGAYQFSRYKKSTRNPARLFLAKTNLAVISQIEAIYYVRDLINIPTEDLGPTEFAAITEKLAKQYKAKFSQIIGDALLKQNYPLIHAVGRASNDAPRLLELRWGNPKHKKLSLVGKGVCFDSGGLDIKTSAGMLLMKKDMGGAAHALGLARMIMDAKLPVYLHVIIPVVENVISGNAYRPGDILASRKGLTVEIGNTDAEGRLVLADALTAAVAEQPDLLIDFATLTGAARVALGTDLPAMFCNHDATADAILKNANQMSDPVWRMPLFSAYRELLNSPIADINNVGNDVYGGAIIAALFLKEFVPDNIPWVHFDMMAWNLKPRPGRPQGGEAMTLRALIHFLEQGC